MSGMLGRVFLYMRIERHKGLEIPRGRARDTYIDRRRSGQNTWMVAYVFTRHVLCIPILFHFGDIR